MSAVATGRDPTLRPLFEDKHLSPDSGDIKNYLDFWG